MKNFVRLLTIALILLLNYSPGDATVRYVRANGTPDSASSVATVNNGVVTALAPGSATITVSTVDGNHTATCAVTVTTPPTPPAGTPVIILTTGANGISLPISMRAAAANTPVWIETSTGSYTPVSVGTDWTTITNYTATGTTLKIHGAITHLFCFGAIPTSRNITGINASGNTNLQYLDCFLNQITSLNLTGLSALQYLECSDNPLTSLNLTGLTALNTLRCHDNQLTSLNLTGLSALRYLDCSNN